MVQRLGARHDQRAVPHDAQVLDDLPDALARRGNVERVIIDPRILQHRDRPGLIEHPLPEFRQGHEHRRAPSDALPLQRPVQQPAERLVIKCPARGAAPQPGLDGHAVPLVLPAALERDLPVEGLNARREVPGYPARRPATSAVRSAIPRGCRPGPATRSTP